MKIDGRKLRFKRQPCSEEQKQKIRETLTGYKHTDEARQNMSIKRKGKLQSKETKLKIGKSQIAEQNHMWKGGVSWYYKKKNHPDYKEAIKNKPDRCEICSVLESDLKRKLAFDHCHTTGKFRGWLCITCNTGLGYARDDTKILQNMINYLNKYL